MTNTCILKRDASLTIVSSLRPELYFKSQIYLKKYLEEEWKNSYNTTDLIVKIDTSFTWTSITRDVFQNP